MTLQTGQQKRPHPAPPSQALLPQGLLHAAALVDEHLDRLEEEEVRGQDARALHAKDKVVPDAGEANLVGKVRVAQDFPAHRVLAGVGDAGLGVPVLALVQRDDGGGEAGLQLLCLPVQDGGDEGDLGEEAVGRRRCVGGGVMWVCEVV